MNIDGSWDQKNNTAGAGGLFRDSRGTWLYGFVIHLGDCSIDMAEMRALHQGLICAEAKNFQLLHVESDSQSSVDMVKKGVNGNLPMANIVHAIQEILNRHQDWKLTFVIY